MYSFDSFLKPQKILTIAKRKGLKGVAITDHGTIKGGLSAKKHNDNDLIIVVGAEIRTEVGDIIGLFLNEEIQSSEIGCVIDEIRAQDGLVILPHPFHGHDLNKFDKDLLKKIDAIEGYNARVDIKKNIHAQEFAKRHKFPVISGSDAHFYGEIGLARTTMEDVLTEDDIRKSILHNNMQIYGMQSPLYYRGGSRILTNIKTGEWYKLPYTLLKISIKGIKKYASKMRREKY